MHSAIVVIRVKLWPSSTVGLNKKYAWLSSVIRPDVSRAPSFRSDSRGDRTLLLTVLTAEIRGSRHR